jgi:Asp-tRNA(Asn)/Glu-tRNA(Gln) amidotransferase A subunit family amidase
MLQVMAGPESFHSVPDYAHLLHKAEPPRLGRIRGLFQDHAEPSVRAMMDRVTEALSKQGATVVDVALPSAFGEVVQQHRIIMAVEAAEFHMRRLRKHPDDYPPKIRSLLQEGLDCRAPDYAEAKKFQRQLSCEMGPCFRDNVVALFSPATTSPAPPAETTGDPAFNSPWSLTGLPVVSFPVGRSADGLPLCIQLIGEPWNEPELFRAAAWCEEKVGVALGDPPL